MPRYKLREALAAMGNMLAGYGLARLSDLWWGTHLVSDKGETFLFVTLQPWPFYAVMVGVAAAMALNRIFE